MKSFLGGSALDETFHPIQMKRVPNRLNMLKTVVKPVCASALDHQVFACAHEGVHDLLHLVESCVFVPSVRNVCCQK